MADVIRGGRGGIPTRIELLFEELRPHQQQAIRDKRLGRCHPSNVPTGAAIMQAVWGVPVADMDSVEMSITEGGRAALLRERARLDKARANQPNA